MNPWPVRDYMPMLPPGTEPLMYALAAGIVVSWVFGLHRLSARYGLGPIALLRQVVAGLRESRVRRVLGAQVLLQQKVRAHNPGGWIHTLIFTSMVALFLGTFIIFVEHDLLRHFGVRILHGPFYLMYELVLDAFGLALIAGVLAALYRRLVLRPAHLPSGAADLWLLWGLLYMGLSGFVLEAIRLTVHPVPWSAFSFAGHLLARGLQGMGADPARLAALYPWVWWSHAGIAFVGLALLPWTKLWHTVGIALNLAVREPRPLAKLSTPFNVMELMQSDAELPERVGIATVADLDWRRRINVDACIACGRCDLVCPARAAGRELAPRSLVESVRTAVAAGPAGADLFAGATDLAAAAWSCTNCYGCVEICPAGVDHIGLVIDLRRHLVSEGRMDDKQAGVLEKMERNGNPYGLSSYSRTDWLQAKGVPTVHENPDFEILYWVGCAAAYDARLQQIALATVAILQAAGISFAILGNEEKCTAESAKRLGEEGRFQMAAMENIALLEGYGVKQILTHCPHGYNVFKHEYPEFGGRFEVFHHTELIHSLVKQGRLPLTAPGPALPAPVVTYHDPCNLGRLGGVYDQPRDLLHLATGGQVLEPDAARNRGFCCGAGGGNAWYSVAEKQKISHLRLEQLAATGAEVVGAACPFCVVMLEDAARTAGSQDRLQVRDVAELVAERLPRKEAGLSGGS